MKVLFVCHANVCRSFMAQELLKHFCPHVQTFSRGLYVDPALEVPDTVRQFLIRQQILPAPHTPTQLAVADMQEAEVVLFMEQQHLEQVTDAFAQYTDKCYLLLEFAYGKQKDVIDPIGLTGRAFDKQATILLDAVRACAQKL